MKQKEQSQQPVSAKPLWTYTIEALIEIILALILLAWPQDGIMALRIILGIGLGLVGIADIYNYIVGSFAGFGQELLSGTVLTALGIALIFQTSAMDSFLFTILAILIITDSLVDLKRSFLLRKYEFTFWYILLALSLIVIILAGVTIFFPSIFRLDILLLILGILLIYEAISTLITLICISVIQKRIQKKSAAQPENTDAE